MTGVRHDAGAREALDPRARRIALVLALGGLLMTIDTTVAVVAVPAVIDDLGISLPAAQGMTTGYLLGVVAVIPTAGRLSERFGARRLYLVALAVFTLASILAAASADAGMLTASRVVQGLGGGLLNPVGQAIGLRAASPGTRGRLMSILGLPVAIGPVIGPPLAGWLVDVASWRWVFWINAPLGLLAIALCLAVLPRDVAVRRGGERTSGEATTASGPLDATGLGLLSLGAVGLVLGCSMIGDAGRVSGASVLAALAGAVLLALGLVRALRVPHPVIDLRLLARRPMGGAALLLALFGAGYFGSMAALPLYVQGVLGGSALDAGLVMIPESLAVGASIQVATRLVDRLPPRRVVLVGTTTALVGAAAMLAAMTQGAGIAALVGAGILIGLGSGATIMPSMTTALRPLDPAAMPRGTTLMALVQQLSSAVGVAAVATTTALLLQASAPRLTGPTGAVEQMLALAPEQRAALVPELALGVGGAFGLVALLIGGSVLAAWTALRPQASTNPEDGAD